MIDKETRDSNSAALSEACNGDITPETVASKILETGTEENDIKAVWIACNYINALSYIDLLKLEIDLLKRV